MEFTIISLFLFGGVGWLLWRHFRGIHFTTTQQRVHCPLHNHSAHVAVRTKLQPQEGPRYVNVTTCSLQNQEPVSPPERLVWVPDLPYSDLRFQKSKPLPIHIGGVSCRKDCLHILNLAEGHGEIGQRRGVLGVMDSPELSREAACKTDSESSTLQTTWTYV